MARIARKRVKRWLSNTIKKPGAAPVELLSAAQFDAIGGQMA
jgi:hypothetical protein